EHLRLWLLSATARGAIGHSQKVAGWPATRREVWLLALFDMPMLSWLVVGGVDNRIGNRVDLSSHMDHSGTSSARISSLPRSSITFTATRRRSPSTKGSLTVPARCAQTDSSNLTRRERSRLSQALVFGKKTCVA